MNTIFDNDLRNLSDNELIYNISNKQVENEQPSFEEFINSLSPSKKKLALNVIELFRRNVEKKKKHCLTSGRRMSAEPYPQVITWRWK